MLIKNKRGTYNGLINGWFFLNYTLEDVCKLSKWK